MFIYKGWGEGATEGGGYIEGHHWQNNTLEDVGGDGSKYKEGQKKGHLLLWLSRFQGSEQVWKTESCEGEERSGRLGKFDAEKLFIFFLM